MNQWPPAPAHLVDTVTCNECGYLVTGRTMDACNAAMFDHAVFAHGEFMGSVFRSKEIRRRGTTIRG